jgi:hypothetical protein
VARRSLPRPDGRSWPAGRPTLSRAVRLANSTSPAGRSSRLLRSLPTSSSTRCREYTLAPFLLPRGFPRVER